MDTYFYLKCGSILHTKKNKNGSITSFAPIPEGCAAFTEIINSGVEITQYVYAEPNAQDKINALEAQQTPRMLRGAALGDADSIANLQVIETEIAELRKQL